MEFVSDCIFLCEEHCRCDGSRGWYEALDLLWLPVLLPEPVCAGFHVLHCAAWECGDDIWNDELFFPEFIGEFLECVEELFEDGEGWFSHEFEDIVLAMFGGELEMSCDEIFDETFHESLVFDCRIVSDA